jgi:hypothetical protein
MNVLTQYLTNIILTLNFNTKKNKNKNNHPDYTSNVNLIYLQEVEYTIQQGTPTKKINTKMIIIHNISYK